MNTSIPQLSDSSFVSGRHEESDSRAGLTRTVSGRQKVVAIYPFIEANPYPSLLSMALEAQGCSVLRIPDLDNFLAWKLLSLCRGADVLHLHWFEGLYRARTWPILFIRTLIFFAMLVVLRSRGTRIVYTLHNLLPHDTKRPRYDRAVRRLLIAFCRTTIVHSLPALEAASNDLGYASKLRVIPHGRFDAVYPNEVSREEARAQLALPRNRRIALFFGSLKERYKGVSLLVAAAEELRRRNITLLIAGDTTGLDENTRSLLARSSPEAIILYDKYISAGEVQLFMRAADCLIVPYVQSFTSGVAILGLGFHLPIVGTGSTAFKELIDRDLCTSCDPAQPESIAAAIERACAWDRRTLAKRCDAFLSECTWEQVAQRHLEAYGIRLPNTASQTGL